MTFSTKEQEIIKWGTANRKTRQEIMDAVSRLRTGLGEIPQPIVTPQPQEPKPEFFEPSPEGVRIRDVAREIPSTILGAIRPIQTTAEIEEGAGRKLTPQEIKDIKIKQAGKAGFAVNIGADPMTFVEDKEIAVGLPFGGLRNVAKKQIVGATKGTVFTILKKLGVPDDIAKRFAPKAIKASTDEEAEIVIKEINESTPSFIEGINQELREVGERVPRFIGRVKEGAEEVATRAERIRTSTPAGQVAIKSGLKEQTINTVQQANKTTRKAFREMVDIAEGTKGGTLTPKQRPEIVAGRAAEEQFKLIEKQRKAIGAQIGEKTAELSKTTKVSMTNSYGILDDVLEQQGVIIKQTEKGIVLDFSNTGFTDAVRKRINEVYKIAREGGEELTPEVIRRKDQLFSQLQRETRMEGLGDIIIETEQGKMNMFQVFRDVFTNELDNLSPELRGLNREYRKFITLQEDIEKSIIKSGNFETTKGVAPAEFAQTNLRRIFSDAQSATAFREIAAEMDKVARSLGYNNATPEELMAFAIELRNIYPDVIPPTSLTGITSPSRTGLLDIATDIAGKIFKAGRPTLTDQQRALRGLLNE